jgi:exodeoxyribonuclease VII large subunit
MIDFVSPPSPQDIRVYSVAELNRQARLLIERGFSGITVEAEVVGLTRAASGHLYFTLADPGGTAQISAVMWRTQALRYGRKIMKGVKLQAVGRMTLYEARGNYQMIVDLVRDAGEGAKAAALAELKKRLAQEGLFDPDRKRPLPPFPREVGIVTSRSGAALRDIIKVVRRRFPVTLVLAHAQVQGEGAPEAIVDALARLGRRSGIDVIILGRGGGSSEDLEAFNAEMVVRAVADAPAPIISAVGHEIDLSLSDLAADRRAATPSEAAELAVPDRRAIEERLAQETDALHIAVIRCVERRAARLMAHDRRLRIRDPRARLQRGMAVLDRARDALARWPERFLDAANGDLSRLTLSLSHWPKPALKTARTSLDALDSALCRWPKQALAELRHRLALLASNLDALSPLSALGRGYAVVRRHPDGSILTDATTVDTGDSVDITLHRGALRCTVDDTLPDGAES